MGDVGVIWRIRRGDPAATLGRPILTAEATEFTERN